MEDGPIGEETLRRNLKDSQILLHCTPVGMYPKVDETCVSGSLLTPNLTVMDIVYNPLETHQHRIPVALVVGPRIINFG